ncbi:MAG: hypothetical protein ACRCY8_15470 [Dermatophilaceae bacterium]
MDDQDATELQLPEVPDDAHEPGADPGPALAERVHVDLARVRPEDMVTSHDTDPPPDPTGGRDTDAEFFIRHVGW